MQIDVQPSEGGATLTSAPDVHPKTGPAPQVEIVRLPVAAGRIEDLVAFLTGHAYFARAELAAHRILAGDDETEVVLVLDWGAAGASKAALVSPEGVALVEGLGAHLAGPPVIAHYMQVR